GRLAVEGSEGREGKEEKEAEAHLYYLLGRYKYRNRQYEDAIRLFAKVPPSSTYFAKAQLVTGVAHVQLRQPVPAVRAFGRIVNESQSAAAANANANARAGGPNASAYANAVQGGEEQDGRMRDLAFLSSARTYYSAAVRATDDGSAGWINEAKLRVAIK